MATKIVGVTVRSGNFEGKPWKNLYISTEVTDKSDTGTVGVFSENHKLQFKKVNEALSLGLSPDAVWNLKVSDFQKLVGKSVRLCFDKYHNLDYVIILSDSSTNNKA